MPRLTIAEYLLKQPRENPARSSMMKIEEKRIIWKNKSRNKRRGVNARVTVAEVEEEAEKTLKKRLYNRRYYRERRKDPEYRERQKGWIKKYRDKNKKKIAAKKAAYRENNPAGEKWKEWGMRPYLYRGQILYFAGVVIDNALARRVRKWKLTRIFLSIWLTIFLK